MADVETSSAARPLTDSPWFWVYLFATAGLLALFWAGPRYAERQSQLDRQFQGREHAVTYGAETESTREYSTPDDKLRSLRPLGYILAVVLGAAWVRLWWQRYRVRREEPSA